MLTLLQWIARLTKGYIRHTGKKPGGLAKLKIKMEAAQKVKNQSKVVTGGFKPKRGVEEVIPQEVIPKETPLTKDASFRVKQGLSTKIKLNTLGDNQQLAKELIGKKNAEFNALNRVSQKEILDRLTINIKNAKAEFATPVKPDDLASGGIAGQLHLNRSGYDNGGTTQKETNPYEHDTLEYWEWYLDKSMSRDSRYMGYWGTAHINDLIKRYEEVGGDALKYKTLFNERLEKQTEHFKSKTPEAQQRWLESEKEDFEKSRDMGIIPGQPKDEISTPIVKIPYEQEIAQGGIAGQLHMNEGGRVSFTKGGKVSSGLARVLGV